MYTESQYKGEFCMREQQMGETLSDNTPPPGTVVLSVGVAEESKTKDPRAVSYESPRPQS